MGSSRLVIFPDKLWNGSNACRKRRSVTLLESRDGRRRISRTYCSFIVLILKDLGVLLGSFVVLINSSRFKAMCIKTSTKAENQHSSSR